MARFLPLMNQRRRWIAFWMIMAGVSVPFWAKYLPDSIGAALVLFSFGWVMVTATVLAFGPKPENPWE